MTLTTKMTDADLGSAVAACGEELQRMLVVWWDKRGDFPESGHQRLEDMLIMAAAVRSWPESCWRLLDRLVELSRRIDDTYRGSGYKRESRPPDGILVRLERVLEIVADIGDPPQELPPRVQALESLEILEKQGVSPRQICQIYGWVDPTNGQPRLEMIEACKAGKVQAPTSITRAAKWPGQPQRQPHPARLHEVADELLRWRQLTPDRLPELVAKYTARDRAMQEVEEEEVQEEIET